MPNYVIPDEIIVERIRAYEKHGSCTKAGCALGVGASAIERARVIAKDRGLTVDSRINTKEEKLRIQNIALQADLKRVQTEADTAEAIRQEVYRLASRTPDPPAWVNADFGKLGHRGAPCTIWSDWHYGEVVRPEEVGGVNEFNNEIAKRRIERLVNVTIDLAFNHMGRAKTSYPGAVVCLGGDMISGDIHEELLATNDRTPQQCINDLTDLIASAFDKMASAFGKVFVPCVVGNHGRATRKPRMKGRIYTSHEWNIYCNLERYFRKDKRISIHVPNETDAYFTIFGHKYLLTHGDSLGVKGGDGIIGSIGPIMRGSIKTSRSEAQIQRDFDTIIMGHWHQYLTLPGIIVNNSLKGFDEFARLALRAPYSRPSQALWFTHPEHGITAHWQVYLEALRTAEDGAKWVEWQEEERKAS